MARQPESRTSRNIKEYLRGRGALAVNIHGGDNPFQEVGIADFLVCYRGRFLAVEVKEPGNSLSPKQHHFKRRVEAAGGLFIEAQSVGDVTEALDGLDRIGGE